nr:hypothetical protein Itr_chr01CG20170 [Ipomoea trifida]
MMPIMISVSPEDDGWSGADPERMAADIFLLEKESRKSHDWVVWSCRIGSRKTDTTPGFWAIDRASSAVNLAENPEKPFV